MIDGKIVAFGRGASGLTDGTAVDKGIIFFLMAHLSGTGINCSMKCQELASAQKAICYLSHMAPVGKSRKWNYKLLPLTTVVWNSNSLGLLAVFSSTDILELNFPRKYMFRTIVNIKSRNMIYTIEIRVAVFVWFFFFKQICFSATHIISLYKWPF